MKIRYKWVPAVRGDGEPFFLSKDVPLTRAGLDDLIRALPETEAIYRWEFCKSGHSKEAYVGETENLKRRVDCYFRSWSKKGMSPVLSKVVEQGFEGRLDVLDIEPVTINQVQICNETLADVFLRQMMHNFVLVEYDLKNCKLHNIPINKDEARRAALKDNLRLRGLRTPSAMIH